MQLFEIFKYLSLVYTGDPNAVFGDYNGDYSRQKRWQTVAVSGEYSRRFRRLSRRFGWLQLPFSATTIGKNYSIRFEMKNHYSHSTTTLQGKED